MKALDSLDWHLVFLLAGAIGASLWLHAYEAKKRERERQEERDLRSLDRTRCQREAMGRASARCLR